MYLEFAHFPQGILAQQRPILRTIEPRSLGEIAREGRMERWLPFEHVSGYVKIRISRGNRPSRPKNRRENLLFLLRYTYTHRSIPWNNLLAVQIFSFKYVIYVGGRASLCRARIFEGDTRRRDLRVSFQLRRRSVGKRILETGDGHQVGSSR